MRENLQKILEESVILKIELTDKSEIKKTIITRKKDFCFEETNDSKIAEVIYNGIVDYGIDECEINLDELDIEQKRALLVGCRFDDKADEETQLKYGFYGEVFLNLIIQHLYKAGVLVAKGNFYDILGGSEIHGYDSFHFYYSPESNILNLTLGEAKFYSNKKSAISNVISNIEKNTKKDYFNKNLLAVVNYAHKIPSRTYPKEIANLIEKWRKNPRINLYEEIISNKINLVYPVLIMSNVTKETFEKEIEDMVEVVNENVDSIKPSIEMDISIGFIFLPVKDSKKIKKEVIQWIYQEKPVI